MDSPSLVSFQSCLDSILGKQFCFILLEAEGKMLLQIGEDMANSG